MSKNIWKFPLKIQDVQTFPVPASSKVVHVGVDPSGKTCIWLEFHTDEASLSGKNVYVIGTGHEFPDDLKHVGSFVQGQFVWHVYE